MQIAYDLMNRFLKLTAVIEVPTGLGLLVVPAIVVRLLLNSEISGAAGLGSGLVGVILWPAVIVHTGMAIWCAVYLGRSP